MDPDMAELLGGMFDDELAGLEEELLGEDEDGFDVDDDGQVLGAFRLPSRFAAVQRSARRSARGGRGGRSTARSRRVISRINTIQRKKAAFLNKIQPAIPGAPAPGARNFPLGFGSFTFVNAGVTSAVLTANPQRPFKGARLVIQQRRSVAALAELVTVTSLNIGQNNQLVSAAALPAEAFAANSFDTVLSLDPATPGIAISLGLAISAAPAVGETVTVSALLIGDTIG